MARGIRGIRDPIATGSLIGRLSAGFGTPEELPAGTVRTFLTLDQEDIEDIIAGLITDTPTVQWTYDDGAGTLKAESFLGASVPATAGSTGTAGQTAYATGFFYVCIATNTWERVAIATWV